MSKILVVGGSGYIGSVLVPVLARKHEVSVVDAGWFGYHLSESIPRIHKNLPNLEEADLAPFDQVIFLAGLSNDPMAEFSPLRNFIENAAYPTHLAYTCKKAGVKRFIYASTTSVYGRTSGEPQTEDMPAVSDYPYGMAKLQGERGCMALADSSFSVIALRKGTVGGYSPRMRLDLVTNVMFMKGLRDKKITVGNPNTFRPTLDVRDAARAYEHAVNAKPIDLSGVFNITGENQTLLDLAETIRGSIKDWLKIDVSLDIQDNFEPRNYRMNTSKARDVLGFEPMYDTRDTVFNLIQNRFAFKDFENPMYYNIIRFKELGLEVYKEPTSTAQTAVETPMEVHL